MQRFICLALIVVLAACSPATAPFPREYTGGPPTVTYDPFVATVNTPAAQKAMPCCADKRMCPLKKKGDCHKDCCKKPCCHGKQKEAETHDDHSHHHTAPNDVYTDVMKKMHEAMGAYTPTGDADTDFVLGMIPHHQGAVDMAEILLEQGDDPKLRQLARGIIVAQQREIAYMNYWLQTRGAMPDTNVTNVNVPR